MLLLLLPTTTVVGACNIPVLQALHSTVMEAWPESKAEQLTLSMLEAYTCQACPGIPELYKRGSLHAVVPSEVATVICMLQELTAMQVLQSAVYRNTYPRDWVCRIDLT